MLFNISIKAGRRRARPRGAICAETNKNRRIVPEGGRAVDRRIQKTRNAIYQAFCGLLNKKSYARITIQEILDAADVGRSTFYSHFESKEDLLQEVCTRLFEHVFRSAPEPRGKADRAMTEKLFRHIFGHLRQDGKMLMGVFDSEAQGLFMKYFRGYMEELTDRYLPLPGGLDPELYRNHVCVSFVGAVQWWFREGCRSSDGEMARQFVSLLPPWD